MLAAKCLTLLRLLKCFPNTYYFAVSNMRTYGGETLQWRNKSQLILYLLCLHVHFLKLYIIRDINIFACPYYCQLIVVIESVTMQLREDHSILNVSPK